MVYLRVSHKVEDYGKWKEAFDGHQGVRTEAGEISANVYRKVNDANDVVVVCKFESVEKAKAFIENPELKEKMQEAGVVSEPVVEFLEDA